MATRLNRSITDQLCARLARAESNGRKVLIFCGDDEPEELGGQICADLFEADGWSVRFAGGGVPDDEVLKLVGEVRPDLLTMFSILDVLVVTVSSTVPWIVLRCVIDCGSGPIAIQLGIPTLSGKISSCEGKVINPCLCHL